MELRSSKRNSQNYSNVTVFHRRPLSPTHERDKSGPYLPRQATRGRRPLEVTLEAHAKCRGGGGGEREIYNKRIDSDKEGWVRRERERGKSYSVR
ncbi:hypothetical protein TIFTF001_006441 [Ficus carica]|uniref:Uncharacterized protein n=1 Tax=Ficus carica TaxID=3494 RepID=A0AA88D0S5_FICCA|nr:hypothetical protein TIFTF001_006441 [Ficus carica]